MNSEWKCSYESTRRNQSKLPEWLIVTARTQSVAIRLVLTEEQHKSQQKPR